MCNLTDLLYASMYYIDAINVCVQLMKHISIKAIHYDYLTFLWSNNMLPAISAYYGSKVALDDLIMDNNNNYVRTRVCVYARSHCFMLLYL